MHRIELIIRGAKDVDVLLYSPNNLYLQAYSMPHMSPVQAYIYVRGLVALFAAGIASNSETAWNFCIRMYQDEGMKN